MHYSFLSVTVTPSQSGFIICLALNYQIIMNVYHLLRHHRSAQSVSCDLNNHHGRSEGCHDAGELQYEAHHGLLDHANFSLIININNSQQQQHCYRQS